MYTVYLEAVFSVTVEYSFKHQFLILVFEKEWSEMFHSQPILAFRNPLYCFFTYNLYTLTICNKLSLY